MKSNVFTRFFARIFRASATPEVLAPKALPSPQVNQALKGLNDEFVTLNYKLLELRSALGTLRDALKELEEANRRRAEARGAVVSVNRIDLN